MPGSSLMLAVSLNFAEVWVLSFMGVSPSKVPWPSEPQTQIPGCHMVPMAIVWLYIHKAFYCCRNIIIWLWNRMTFDMFLPLPLSVPLECIVLKWLAWVWLKKNLNLFWLGIRQNFQKILKIDVYKIKASINVDNPEHTLCHTAVSNIQSKFNLLYKNKHIHFICMQICFCLQQVVKLCIPKDCFKIRLFVIYYQEMFDTSAKVKAENV